MDNGRGDHEGSWAFRPLWPRPILWGVAVFITVMVVSVLIFGRWSVGIVAGVGFGFSAVTLSRVVYRRSEPPAA